MLKWRENFSCNIEEIDNQHKKLFEIGTRLYTLATLNDEYDHFDEIMEILDELRDYTIYHFQFEEKLMSTYTYASYDIHKIEHDFFVKKLQRLEKKDFEGQQQQSVIDIITFVADWVSGHILKTDMLYKDFFNSKGVQ